MPLDFSFKTEPYAHQLVDFERYHDADYFALFYEQRCGKTKPALDIAAHRYLRGDIKSLLVVAPNNVHLQWELDAIPEHLPDETRYLVESWHAAKIKQLGYRARLKRLLEHDGLRVLCVNIDAIDTKSFKDYANALFRRGRVMTVLDESSDIATERAKRSRAALKLGRASRVRAILDGTPAATGPLGLYSQCEFLAPACLGFASYHAYKARYAVLKRYDFGDQTRTCPDCAEGSGFTADNARCQRCHGRGKIGRTEAQVVVGFQHVDELGHRLRPFSTRLLRSDCHDLPPKIFNKVYFELDPESRRVYDDLRETFVAELSDGRVVTAPMVLTRYIRLQQIASGFLPTAPGLATCPGCGGHDSEACAGCDGLGVIETDVRAVPLTPTPRRLEALLTAVEPLTGPGIIWAQFDHDIDAILALASAREIVATRYDGHTSAADKRAAVSAFQAGQTRWFVAKQRAAGRGLDLARAGWMAYYSHGWSLRMRLQSEDRAQSLKKRDAVLYLDLVGVDTVDDKIVRALRERKRISDLITGDDPRAWL